MPILFVGWTHKTFLSRKELIALGVTGSMRRNEDGNICHCEATYDVMIKLIEAGLSNPGSFTAIDSDTEKQLPPRKQTFWHWKQ